MIGRVLKFIKEEGLIEGGRVVVGVSGGPDSLALLHILYSLREELGIEIISAHLNHMLREEAELDEKYVEEVSKKLGVVFVSERRDIKKLRGKRSIEEAAREERYDFLCDVALRFGTDTIAVGHTASDQVETVLLHFLRGMALPGLSGMKPLSFWKRGDKTFRIIRPLLEVRREETLSYCVRENLSPRFDESNLSLSFTRNRIRLKILPILRNFNPKFDEAVIRASRASRMDLDFIEGEVGKLWGDVIEEDGYVRIKNRAFLELHPSLKRHLIRKAIEKISGTLKDIEYSHIEGICELMEKPQGKELHLPYGVKFYGSYDESYIYRGELPSPFPPLESEYEVKVPGETRIPGWVVRTEVLDKPLSPDDPFSALFDLDDLGVLSVRGRRRGDRFRPEGGRGKKLKEFMIDEKIPRIWRDNIPLLLSDGEIIWVVGFKRGERGKIKPGTEKFLLVRFVRS